MGCSDEVFSHENFNDARDMLGSRLYRGCKFTAGEGYGTMECIGFDRDGWPVDATEGAFEPSEVSIVEPIGVLAIPRVRSVNPDAPGMPLRIGDVVAGGKVGWICYGEKGWVVCSEDGEVIAKEEDGHLIEPATFVTVDGKAVAIGQRVLLANGLEWKVSGIVEEEDDLKIELESTDSGPNTSARPCMLWYEKPDSSALRHSMAFTALLDVAGNMDAGNPDWYDDDKVVGIVASAMAKYALAEVWENQRCQLRSMG